MGAKERKFGLAFNILVIAVLLVFAGFSQAKDTANEQKESTLLFSSKQPSATFNLPILPTGGASMTTEMASCFEVNPKKGTKKLTVTYHPATCGFCGKKTLKVRIGGLAEPIGIPVKVSCNADMLVFESAPSGRKSYASALSDWIDALAGKGLTVLDVNVDSFQFNGNLQTLKKAYALDRNKPDAFIRAIQEVSKAADAKYVILLGNTDQIPMPDIGDRQIVKKGKEICEFSANPPCRLPSDRAYALLENRRYVTQVTRIPGPDYLVESKFRQYAEIHRQGGLRIARKGITLQVDSCGGTNIRQTKKGIIAEKDCAFFEDIGKTLKPVFGISSCTRENNCLLTPPFCLSCNGKTSDCLADSLKSRFEKASLLYIDQHGSGNSFSSVTVKGQDELFCVAGNSDFFGSLKLGKFPPVITTACYGASIDEDTGGNPLIGSQGTAKSLLYAGAPIYIGSTRTNFALTAAYSKIGPEDELAYRTNLNFVQQITQSVLTCRDRIGDCFYRQMDAYERLFLSEGIAASRWKDRQTVRQYQLYGDPTLKIQVDG